MVQVYRIETAEGKGVCITMGSRLCSVYRSLCKDETEHCSFDGFDDELRSCRLMHNKNMVYAFPSMHALFNWFPQGKGRAAMEAAGALGVIYDVDHVEVSTEYQCIFDKSKATRVSTFSLSKE